MSGEVCEGCKAPATTRDSDGVPLCDACFDALPVVDAAEWCHEHEDYYANCGCNTPEGIADAEEERRVREDDDRFQQGDAYDHNRGACWGIGACRYCDEGAIPPEVQREMMEALRDAQKEGES